MLPPAVMKKLLIVTGVVALGIGGYAARAASSISNPVDRDDAACKGDAHCKVCTDCSRCAYCKAGGKCGTCK